MAEQSPRLPFWCNKYSRKVRLVTHNLVGKPAKDPPYLIFVPESYEPGYAYPLLVWLHGLGGDEQQLLRVMPFISLRNYLAVAPRGLAVAFEDGSRGFGWPQTAEALDFAQEVVTAAVEAIGSRYHVAVRRTFLCGFADGGTMAIRLALSQPHRFAGAASLCGQFPMWGRPLAGLRSQRALTFLFLTGARSCDFSPEEACRALKLLHSAGINVVLRQYPCGDQMHQAMLADLNRWIMGEVTGERPFIAGAEPPSQVLRQRALRPSAS
ncbi:MAG: alpha/beta hydrolase-fold protein [Thermoguttaceae bacterium]|nr:alpha/beta hydrolase-fold protein [Thermoguttaceae bacterium]MDW8079343.1 alpha/beta hydrolase-fold protein [Thermoguttaceae bacterium]